MRDLFKFGIAGLALTLAGCATTAENVVKTGVNGILAPAKVVRATVEDLNPVQGVREGVVDTVESTYNTLAVRDSGITPDQKGKANNYINEHPALKAVVDTGVAAGGAYGIANWAGAGGHHITQSVGYATAGQAIIEGVNYKLKE